VLHELGDVEKTVSLTPSEAGKLLTYDFRLDFTRRLLASLFHEN
jgi:hypothetical protein